MRAFACDQTSTNLLPSRRCRGPCFLSTLNISEKASLRSETSSASEAKRPQVAIPSALKPSRMDLWTVAAVSNVVNSSGMAGCPETCSAGNCVNSVILPAVRNETHQTKGRILMLMLELKSVGKQTKSPAQLTSAVCYISRDVVNTP